MFNSILIYTFGYKFELIMKYLFTRVHKYFRKMQKCIVYYINFMYPIYSLALQFRNVRSCTLHQSQILVAKTLNGGREHNNI